jgi:hypothetical protein
MILAPPKWLYQWQTFDMGPDFKPKNSLPQASIWIEDTLNDVQDSHHTQPQVHPLRILAPMKV